MKLSEKTLDCRLSPIRKFHPYAVSAAAQGKTIYHLNIGQPDIHTPAVYRDALKSFSESVLAYAPSPGIPELIDAIRGYYCDIGVRLERDNVLVTTGGSEALDITMKCILDEDSEVIVAEPFYPNYYTFIRSNGGRVVPIPTCAENGYRFASREKIEPLITKKTRAILFTNPGNPTGTILSQEDLRLLADIAKEHDLYLIGDEVYREFIYDGSNRLSTIGSMEDVKENIILIDSVSKRFSACGARIGAMISRNTELMQQALKLAQARLSVATVDQLAAAALYSVDQSYFKAVRKEYRHRRDVCYAKLMEIPGVVCAEPMGAFYMMAKLPVDDTDKFQRWLLEEFEDHGETLMFAPGSGFYAAADGGRQEARFAYVLEAPKLARAMEILKKAIEQYNNR